MAALADWRVFLAVIGLFIVVFAIWRMVSLGSVIAAGTYPIATFFVTFFTDYYHGGIVSLKYVLIVTAITALMVLLTVMKKNYLEIKKKFKYEKNIQCLALDVFISE